MINTIKNKLATKEMGLEIRSVSLSSDDFGDFDLCVWYKTNCEKNFVWFMYDKDHIELAFESFKKLYNLKGIDYVNII